MATIAQKVVDITHRYTLAALKTIVREHNKKLPIIRGYSRMQKHHIAAALLKHMDYDIGSGKFRNKAVSAPPAPRVLPTRRKGDARPRVLPTRRTDATQGRATPARATPLQGTLSKGMQTYKNKLEDIEAKWKQRALQGFDTEAGGIAFKN